MVSCPQPADKKCMKEAEGMGLCSQHVSGVTRGAARAKTYLIFKALASKPGHPAESNDFTTANLPYILHVSLPGSILNIK